MTSDDDTSRREVLQRTTENAAVDREPHRRGVLRGTVATAGAALGLPLVGSADAEATDDSYDRFARPESVHRSVDANEGLFDAVEEIGLTEGAWSAGLQVKLLSVDGTTVPEHRLYFEAEHGMVSVVVSRAESPLGGSAHVVTDPERMDAAPFEWPREAVSELPDGRLVFRVDRDGWGAPVSGFGETDVEIPYLECVHENMVSCAPSSLRGIDCEFVSCCGTFHSDCHAGFEEPCQPEDYCEVHCWRNDGECKCWLREDCR